MINCTVCHNIFGIEQVGYLANEFTEIEGYVYCTKCKKIYHMELKEIGA